MRQKKKRDRQIINSGEERRESARVGNEEKEGELRVEEVAEKKELEIRVENCK